MFGQNPQLPYDSNGHELHVQSIFYTLQGEGPYAGAPAVFIRLAGCNLACTFCDTEFSTGMTKPRVSVAEIVALTLGACPTVPPLVVVTGGEPLRQNLLPLLANLDAHAVGHVQIETAGTLGQPLLDPLLERGFLSLVCSPKTPKVHPWIQRCCKHWKYIVRAGDSSDYDGLPVGSTQPGQPSRVEPLARPQKTDVTCWVSPCDEYDPVKNKANLDEAVRSCLEHGHRLTVQMHKLAGIE